MEKLISSDGGGGGKEMWLSTCFPFLKVTMALTWWTSSSTWFTCRPRGTTFSFFMCCCWYMRGLASGWLGRVRLSLSCTNWVNWPIWSSRDLMDCWFEVRTWLVVDIKKFIEFSSPRVKVSSKLNQVFILLEFGKPDWLVIWA